MYRIFLIAILCFAGVTTVHADDDANAKLFEVHSRLAAKGIAEAQFKLGEMYEEGRGTPRDLVKAREWYEQAAKQGHEEAQRRLNTLGSRKSDDDADKMAQEALLIKRRAEEERQAALTQKREEEERRAAAERKRMEEERDRQVRQRAEDERMRQLQMQKRVDDDQKARQTVLQRKQEEDKAKAAAATQPAMQKPAQSNQPAGGTKSTGKADEQESFETDPCKSAASRFMSTCR